MTRREKHFILRGMLDLLRLDLADKRYEKTNGRAEQWALRSEKQRRDEKKRKNCHRGCRQGRSCTRFIATAETVGEVNRGRLF